MPATSPSTDATLVRDLHELEARWPRLAPLIAAVCDLAADLGTATTQACDYHGLGADGLRSPSMEPGRGTGGHADPTASAVLAACATWPERPELRTRSNAAVRIAALAVARLLHQDDEHEARRRLLVIAEDLRAALGRAHRALPAPNTLTRLHADDVSDPGCRSCSRAKDSRGRPMYAPTAAKTGGRGGLCRWCTDWVADRRRTWLDEHRAEIVETWLAWLCRQHGASVKVRPFVEPDTKTWWPPVGIVEDHHAGRRITAASVAKAERAAAWRADRTRKRFERRGKKRGR